MARKKRSRPPRTIWAYAYELVPPQSEDRMHPIRTVLDLEHSEARSEERTWTGSVVLERQITHILVVSDSPEQNLGVNHRLEAKLREMKAGFSITAPLLVADDAAPLKN